MFFDTHCEVVTPWRVRVMLVVPPGSELPDYEGKTLREAIQAQASFHFVL